MVLFLFRSVHGRAPLSSYFYFTAAQLSDMPKQHHTPPTRRRSKSPMFHLIFHPSFHHTSHLTFNRTSSSCSSISPTITLSPHRTSSSSSSISSYLHISTSPHLHTFMFHIYPFLNPQSHIHTSSIDRWVASHKVVDEENPSK